MNKTMLRLVLAAAALLAVAAFVAYRQPALLFDFINLRYCG